MCPRNPRTLATEPSECVRARAAATPVTALQGAAARASSLRRASVCGWGRGRGHAGACGANPQARPRLRGSGGPRHAALPLASARRRAAAEWRNEQLKICRAFVEGLVLPERPGRRAAWCGPSGLWRPPVRVHFPPRVQCRREAGYWQSSLPGHWPVLGQRWLGLVAGNLGSSRKLPLPLPRQQVENSPVSVTPPASCLLASQASRLPLGLCAPWPDVRHLWTCGLASSGSSQRMWYQIPLSEE
ncbi:PREDICTED: uncharacterized protein LOC105853582 [Condylura cristata]|uniref:uncharacterized protein LOC105853582 n=1 Tax=Condylura cristata TaxID=143302 RepID=UPI000642C51E|nr:PREDICTED: uncharacterized protein LOC105853582 [Condylura cristata]